jgi:hypothetical protein
MTEAELASLEPVIAQAWDRWDLEVRSSSLLYGSVLILCLAPIKTWEDARRRRLRYFGHSPGGAAPSRLPVAQDRAGSGARRRRREPVLVIRWPTEGRAWRPGGRPFVVIGSCTGVFCRLFLITSLGVTTIYHDESHHSCTELELC